MLGLALSILGFFLQKRYGFISHGFLTPEMKVFIYPYLAVILLFATYYVVTTPWRLDQKREAQFEAEQLARSNVEKQNAVLQQRLQNLSIELMSVEAMETLHPENSPSIPAYHRVYIDFTLKASNGDGQNASTIEPVACASDLRSNGQCDRLGFNENVYDNLVERDLFYRRIPAGAIRFVTLRAVYDLPMSDSHILATKLSGILTLRDNRGTLLPTVPFVADLAKRKG